MKRALVIASSTALLAIGAAAGRPADADATKFLVGTGHASTICVTATTSATRFPGFDCGTSAPVAEPTTATGLWGNYFMSTTSSVQLAGTVMTGIVWTPPLAKSTKSDPDPKTGPVTCTVTATISSSIPLTPGTYTLTVSNLKPTAPKTIGGVTVNDDRCPANPSLTVQAVVISEPVVAGSTNKAMDIWLTQNN